MKFLEDLAPILGVAVCKASPGVSCENGVARKNNEIILQNRFAKAKASLDGPLVWHGEKTFVAQNDLKMNEIHVSKAPTLSSWTARQVYVSAGSPSKP